MKNGKMKRILSALLTLCLFVGLMPQITLDNTASAAAADVYYNFTKANTGTYGATAAEKREQFASLTYDAVAACNPNASSGEWAYHSYSCTSTDSTEGDSYAGYGYETGLGFIMLTASRKNEMHTAVKMKVENAGKYVPFINLHGGYFPAYAGVITANFREINTDGTLGTTLASKKIHTGGIAAANDFTALSDVAIELEAKEYALEVVIDNERSIVIVSGLRLRAATNTTTVSFTIDDNVGYVEVNVGETVTLPMVVMGSNGEKYPCSASTNWGHTENNSYVTLSIDKYAETVSFTGVAETSTPQMVEFTNGYAQARVNVVVKPEGYVKPAEDLYYDFTKVLPDYVTVNHKHNMTELLTYAMSTPGAYGEINKWTGTASNTSVDSDPWAFLSIEDTVKFSPLFHNYGVKNMGKGVTDIKIRVPVSGTYRPYLNIPTAYPTGTPVIVSVLDEDGNTLATKTIAAGSGGNTALSDNALKLEKGEYIVRFNKTEVGTTEDAGSNFYDGVYLYYIEETELTDLVYDFMKGWTGDTTADYVKTITYDMTESGGANEINTSIVSEAWAYQGDTSTGGNNYFKYNYKNYGLCKSYVGTGTLKLKVPTSGYYIPQANLYYSTKGNAVVTLKNYDAATDTVGDEIIQLNTPVSATETMDYVFGGKVFLAKGEYALEITAANVSGSAVIINNFKLIATDSDELGSIDVDLKANYYNDTIGYYADYPEMNTDEVKVTLYSTNGEDITDSAVLGENYSVTYSSSDTEVATVDANGTITALKLGETTISVTATLYGISKSKTYTFEVVTGGKNRRSYYRDDKVAAMRENATKYTFAKNTMNSAVKNSAKYLENPEKLWNSVTSQELPRSYFVGYRGDPNYSKCRYCGVDLVDKYGSPYYAWEMDAWNNPWKVTCPDCSRDFPSNDFGSFYELGIGSDGKWSYELAKSENAKLVAAGEEGYLVNTAYPEKGTGWGVDDGYGYKSSNTFVDSQGATITETHTYISFYNHWAIWHTSLLYNATTQLRNAYLYTGDESYGRVGAILIDRIADVYPDMSTSPYMHFFTDGGHYAPQGKVSDYVWENQLAEHWAKAYDAFWPMYEDEEVISILSERAATYNMANDKTTAAKIRKNCEDGILREIYKSVQNGKIWGNFGMYQSTLAMAAVALDSFPETVEMLDWIFQDGENLMLDGSLQVNCVTGGNVNRQLFDAVDANGFPDEVAPNYNELWVDSLYELVDRLAGYDKYAECDFFNNPKYIKMNTQVLDLLVRRKSALHIGDSGATALDKFMVKENDRYVLGFMYTKNPIFAQVLYLMNGNKADGLHYPATHADPMALEREVQAIIDSGDLYDFDKSLMLTDYGYSALKKPRINEDETTETTYWMFYGRYAGHGHRDSLNLGIDAKGLAVAPDFGYPTNTSSNEYDSWGKTTTAHNTVVVDDGRQYGIRTTGFPHHFDDAGRVKVMDASAEHQYTVDDYRRTVVTVGVDEDDTYAVDFFHVNGGSEHLYSFHALADTVTTSGLTLTPQVDSSGDYVGTYQGADVAFGAVDSNKIGYTYLYNVDRDATVSGGNFSVDFQIEDYRGVRETEQDTHLKMTMINGFDLAEVALADGNPPKRDLNPEKVKFVLARRSGTDLNSLFTTVYEPYNTSSNIASISAVDVVRADGATITDAEKVRAVKVTLNSGRVDYITFADNTNVEYKVDNLFNVKGFVTVYTLEDGVNTYSYVNDGTKVGSLTTTDAYTGKIEDFTKENAFENELTVSFNSTVDADELIGRYLYVDNGGDITNGNATYEILGVTKSGSNYVLDIGDITLIDKLDENGDYVYKVEEDDTFRIPLSKVSAESEVTLEAVTDQSLYAAENLSLTLSATSSIGNSITYYATDLPDGAVLNASTGKFSWTPTVDQIGEHTVTFTADDGIASATATVKITVKTPFSVVILDTGDDSETVTVNYGATMPTVAVPEKEGYVFDGYYDGEDGTGTQYYKANGVSARTWDKTGNVTLYAKWVEGSDIFGTMSAYIRNISFVDTDNSTKYRIYLFAGIDTLDYSEVGFEISAGGKTANIDTNVVYSSFQASNATVTPATLGSKCTRIFAESVTFSESLKTAEITIRPYAVDIEGNYIYGKYTTINGAYTK